MSTGKLAFLGAARYQGQWNATSNAASGSGIVDAAFGQFPTLLIDGGYDSSTNLTASAGDYWQVTGSGTTLIDGESKWGINDWCVYSGSSGAPGTWIRLAFEDTIASVIIGDLSAPSTFNLTASADKHVLFVTGTATKNSVMSGSSNFMYDYTTNIATLPSSSFTENIHLADDKKLYFGSDDDTFIEYNEEGDDFLVISGSAKGIVLSGTTVQIAGTLEGASPLKIGGEIEFISQGKNSAFNFGRNKEAKVFYNPDEKVLVLSGSSLVGANIAGPNVIIDGKLGVGISCRNTNDITHAITLPNDSGIQGAVKANSFISYSSVRYKENIEVLNDPMSVLEKLNGVSFKWKDSGNQDYGFIAEDVGEILPDIVAWDDNKKDAQGINYLKLISFLVEAVKKQNSDIIDLNQELTKTRNSFNKKLAKMLFGTAFIILLLML